MLALGALAACNYGFRGGGGFPSEIRTIYIQPFENNTPYGDLDQDLFRRLNERLPRALGVRPAGAEVADALVRGRITGYDDQAQNYRPGDTRGNVQVLEHQVQITVAIELINRRSNTMLWEQSITGRGAYQPNNQTDRQGRELAINNLLQQIVDGAQSQW